MPSADAAEWTIGARGRLVLALPLLGLAVLPAFTWVSQQKLDAASYAFAQGNCAAAQSAALSSISVLGNRPDPYELVAYCDVRKGRPRAALTAIKRAVSLDPGSWTFHYDLVVMEAAAGFDPRAAAAQTLAMDPREPLVQQEWRMFRAGGISQWEKDAQNIVYSVNVL